MSKFIFEDNDYSKHVPSLSFNCGICNSGNTFIKFNYVDGNGGQVSFECDDCKAYFYPTHYDEWIIK